MQFEIMFQDDRQDPEDQEASRDVDGDNPSNHSVSQPVNTSQRSASANTSVQSLTTNNNTANADATSQSGQQASIEQAAASSASQRPGSQAKRRRKRKRYRPYGSHTAVTVSNLTIVLIVSFIFICLIVDVGSSHTLSPCGC